MRLHRPTRQDEARGGLILPVAGASLWTSGWFLRPDTILREAEKPALKIKYYYL